MTQVNTNDTCPLCEKLNGHHAFKGIGLKCPPLLPGERSIWQEQAPRMAVVLDSWGYGNGPKLSADEQDVLQEAAFVLRQIADRSSTP